MRKKTLIIFAGILVAALAGGAWWWQQAAQVQAQVVASLPAAPSFDALPAIVADQVASAETEARSLTGARAGLARLSRIYHANGFLREAMQCYAGLEQLEPSDPRWPHLHATLLAGFGEIEPAMVLWRRVLTLAPDFIPAQLRLGDCELKSNHAAEAAAIYSAVLQKEPGNSYALLGLARLDFEARRWTQAQERLETVVKQTNFALGYDLIVSLYEQTGQTGKARAIRASQKASGAFRDPPDPWLDGLMDVCYDPYRLALSAGFLARNGDPAKAIQLLERAVDLNPEDVSTHFQLGTLNVAQGRLPQAREQLERCTRLAPEFADGWAQLSALQVQQGEASAAAQTLAKGLANCPQSPGLHLMRAQNLQDAGQRDGAIAEYRESIRLRPNEAEAYIKLANFYINLGQTDDAIQLLQQSLEAEPGNPMALGTLAFHAISIGDEPAALRWLEKVRNQPRVSPEQVAKLRAAYQEQFGHALP